MPTARSSRLANLTPETLAQLADRDDTVVYEPVHDTIFEPWPATRVRRVVELIVGITRTCTSEDDARGKVRAVGGDVAEFEGKYQLMFQRLTQPEIARNPGHVKIILDMINLRSQIDGGSISESEAQRLVSERALAGLIAQAQRASSQADQ